MPPKVDLEKELDKNFDPKEEAPIIPEDKPATKQEEPKKEEPKKESPDKGPNPLGSEIIDEKSAEKERKAQEKAEAKKKKAEEKQRAKTEKARKKAEEAELARRKAESDEATYKDLPPNPGFWRTIASFLMKLVTGQGFQDVEQYFAAKNKMDAEASKMHKGIEESYKKELEQKEKDKETLKELEKEEPEKTKTEPEKTSEKKEPEKTETKKEETKKEETKEDGPQKEEIKKEEPKKEEPKKEEVKIDLTAHGETKQDEGEKKDFEKLNPEEKANFRTEEFIKKNFKGENLSPTQKQNLKQVFLNAENGRANMQKNLDDTVSAGRQYCDKPENNMRDFVAGQFLDQYLDKHPERKAQLLEELTKPHFANNVSKTATSNMGVVFAMKANLNVESMKAYLAGGDKLQNVVQALDEGIARTRQDPQLQDKIKKAQNNLKEKVKTEKEKIEEKEKKLNDATKDKQKINDTIEQKMIV